MTSLHVSEALCKAVDYLGEVIWESWGCDPLLEQGDFGVKYPVRWTGRCVVVYRPSAHSQHFGPVDVDATYTDDFPCNH